MKITEFISDVFTKFISNMTSMLPGWAKKLLGIDTATDSAVQAAPSPQVMYMTQSQGMAPQLGKGASKNTAKSFQDVIKDSSEFRQAFPLPSGPLASGQSAQNLQLRENESLYRAGIGDDPTVEHYEHGKNSKHRTDQAIDIPVTLASIDPSQGDRVSQFWKDRGYKVIWKDGGAHDNHVHVSWDETQAAPQVPGALPAVKDGVFPASTGAYNVYNSNGQGIASTSPGDHLIATPNVGMPPAGGSNMDETNRLLKDLISQTRGLQMIFEKYAEKSSVVVMGADTTRRLSRTISTMK